MPAPNQPICVLLLALTPVACSVADRGAIPTAEPAAASASVAVAVAVAASSPIAAAQSASNVLGQPPACPVEMVLAGRVCIDRYEAHLVAVAADGTLAVHPGYQRPTPDVTYRAASALGIVPQGYISRIESAAACGAAGKRLCSRSEWQLACRGTPSPKPPAKAICNSGKQHLLTLMFNQPFHYDEHFNNPELNQLPGFLARTGEYEACESAVGAHDMVGNLHEWVTDSVTSAVIVQLESDGVRRQYQPAQVGNGMFMGGFYSTSGEHGPGCLFTTIAHEPAYHDYSTGFRCCQSLP